MQGWLIFKHAVAMLWGNKPSVVRIFLFPFLLVFLFSMASTYLALGRMPIEGAQTGNMPFPNFGVFFVLLSLSTFILIITVLLWTIVAWHRFILLEEPVSGFFPSFRGQQMFGYALRILLIVVVLMIPAFVLLSLVGLPDVMMTPEGPSIGAGFLVRGFAVTMLLSISFYLLSPILPAIAIGKNISLGRAFGATVKGFWSIAVCVVIVTALTVAGQTLASLIGNASALLESLTSIVFEVVFALLNLSILTTLYGHYVEGREL